MILTLRIIIFIFSFLCSAISQTTPKVFAPGDDKQIEGIIYSVVQGVRQHRSELIANHFFNESEDITTNLQNNLKIKQDANLFFSKSKDRKLNQKWIKSSPDSSLAVNWDFEITKPEITITGSQASAKFKFYWLLDAPFVNDSSITELFHPTQKTSDIWHFRKVNGMWRIDNTDLFLDLFGKLEK